MKATVQQKFAAELKRRRISVTDAESLRLTPSDAGITIPYLHPVTGKPHSKVWRTRFWEENKEGRRYGQPLKSGVEVYFPAIIDWKHILSDTSIPVLITEGEFKACAACQLDMPCIAIGGVDSYGGVNLTPWLRLVNWKGRAVDVCYDSDLADKEGVAEALKRFSAALDPLGAKVRALQLPDSEDGEKVGLDDYLHAKGRKAFARLRAAAQKPGPEPRREGLLTKWVSEHLQSQGRYVPQLDHWILLKNNVLEPDITNVAWGRVNELCETLAAQQPKKTDRIWMDRASTATAVMSKLRGLQVLSLTTDKLDQEPSLIGLSDGSVLDGSPEALRQFFRTGKIPARPDPFADAITKRLSVVPEPGEPKAWLRCLRQWMHGDDGVIGMVQRAFGYSLTGLVCEEKFFYVLGPEGTGKSKLLDPIFDILGTYAYAMPRDLVEDHGEKHEPHAEHVSGIEGKRFALFTESGEGARLNEKYVKALTGGGDPLPARALYGKARTLIPVSKLWIMSNHDLGLRGSGEGIRRRLLLIPFDARPSKPDMQLLDKLKAERGRILYWMLQGLRDWHERGLDLPQCILTASAEYVKSQDPFGQWFEEQCTAESGAEIRLLALYTDFEMWARGRGQRWPPRIEKLRDWLKGRGYELPPKRHDGRYVVGIRLASKVGLNEQFRGGKVVQMRR
ncbi:MAG TPA: phage/plasmid primase, P4 family [Terracidiphilus sp.]|jgi:putative DNA primase/helicase